MCRLEKEVKTEANNVINAKAIFGTISADLGLTQFTQQLFALNVPSLTCGQFNKKFQQVAKSVAASSWETLQEVGIEEACLAREIGDIDENGIPLISVIADGAWSKRLYKINYDASSGVPCIVGARTGKLLFLGVRHKYCPVFERRQVEKLEVKEHVCFKNWSGTSTLIEADNILEGFKRSMEMHGVKYVRLY